MLLAATSALRAPPLRTRPPTMAASSAPLFRWGEANGVEYGGSLGVAEFDGIRGVAAEETLSAGTRVLAVPAPLALQVTTEQPAPKWADKELWRSSTWYVRLALRLLHEKSQGAASELAPWVEQLPKSFDTPFFWTDDELAALRYRPLQDSVEKQKKEWAAVALKVRQQGGGAAPSDEQLFWALSCVRSRAFSGPWSRGSIKASASQLAFAAFLALVYVGPLGGPRAPAGHTGRRTPLERASERPTRHSPLSTRRAPAEQPTPRPTACWRCSRFCSPTICSSRGSRVRGATSSAPSSTCATTPQRRRASRWRTSTLPTPSPSCCPRRPHGAPPPRHSSHPRTSVQRAGHSHLGARPADLRAPKARPPAAQPRPPPRCAPGPDSGGEVRICYGPRSNDQLLQNYGFVEAANPHDTFMVRQDDFVLALNAAAPFAPANVQALRSASLTDPAAPLQLTPAGADKTALRVARILLHPAAAAAAGGQEALPLAAEVDVLRALAALADAQAAAMAAQQGGGFGDTPAGNAAAQLARAFRAEKAALLAKSAAALRAQADANTKAGRVLEAQGEQAATGPRVPLPGFGLSRIE